MGKRAIFAAALAGVASFLIGPVFAQETKQETKKTSSQATVSPVTQDQLNTADKNAKNFLLTNVNYAHTRFHPARQIGRDNLKNIHFAWIFQPEAQEYLQTSSILLHVVFSVSLVQSTT